MVALAPRRLGRSNRRIIGGSYIAYRDHVAGFAILTVASLLSVGLLGWRFWKGRRDITLLTVGMIQAILGLGDLHRAVSRVTDRPPAAIASDLRR